MTVTAFDTETYLIVDGLRAPPMVCGSFADRDEWQVLARDEALNELHCLLIDGVPIVGHYIPYDFAVACAERPILIPHVFRHFERGLVRDTKIRQQLIDCAAGCLNYPRRPTPEGVAKDMGYGLADLLFHHTGRDRRESKKDTGGVRLRFAEVDGLPVSEYPPEFKQYALEDATDTLDVFYRQGPDELVNEQEQVRKSWALHLISCWGLRTNAEAVARLDAWASGEWKALQHKMFLEGLFRFEPLDAEDRWKGRAADGVMPEVLTKTGKVSVLSGRPAKYVRNMDVIRARVSWAFRAQGKQTPLTEKGAISTDADCLDQTGDPLLQELGEAGPVGTIVKTFLPVLKKGTVTPINTRFNSLLETGRVSSAEPNLNNLPREGGVRECIEARPGFVICSVDFDCAELRGFGQVIKWLFGKSRFAEFFQRDPDGDPHLALAARKLGISYAEAATRKKAGDPVVKDRRQKAKPVNFGYMGGLGPDTFIVMSRKNYGIHFTREEAAQDKEAWLDEWDLREYFAYINLLVGIGYADIMQLKPPGLGTPHRIRGKVGYTDAANGFVQGLIADAAGDALWGVSRECYVDHGTALFGSRPIGFLYDEVLAEVPIETAHEAAYRMRDVMLEWAQPWLPDVPLRATPALMRVWSKAADAVFEDGRLVPWEKRAA